VLKGDRFTNKRLIFEPFRN